MTVIQLECFLEAVRQNSFSMAASNLYLSQSSLSRHVQALEHELRAPLFIRANNTVRLTPIGQQLYPMLDDLYWHFRTVSTKMQELVNHQIGLLKIGILAGIQLDDRFRDAITVVKAKYDLQVQIYHLDLQESYSALMGGDVDVLLTLDASMPPTDKALWMELFQEPMCLAVPAEHPNAGLSSIRHEDVERYFPELELCVIDAGEFESSIQAGLRSVFPGYTAPKIEKLSGKFASLDTLMMRVDAGVAITCINESCILNGKPSVRLIPLADDSGTRTVSVRLYWLDKNANPFLSPFLEIIKGPRPST